MNNKLLELLKKLIKENILIEVHAQSVDKVSGMFCPKKDIHIIFPGADLSVKSWVDYCPSVEDFYSYLLQLCNERKVDSSSIVNTLIHEYGHLVSYRLGKLTDELIERISIVNKEIKSGTSSSQINLRDRSDYFEEEERAWFLGEKELGEYIEDKKSFLSEKSHSLEGYKEGLGLNHL